MVLLTNLADVLRAAGLNVVEIPGWKTRGRPGKFNPNGVLCHHTAGTDDRRAYAEWMALVGRPDLSAPLAQLGLSRTGIVYVLAAGRANHAGKAKAFGTQPAGDGNEMYVGIEAMNTGSEGWSSAQRHAYVKTCAALNVAYGWSARNTAGHKETSLSGKPDPGLMSMPDFRADVAKAMTALTTLTPTPSEEDDMFTDKDRALLEYVSKQVKATAQLVVDKDADNLTATDLAALVPDEIAKQVIETLSARLSNAAKES